MRRLFRIVPVVLCGFAVAPALAQQTGPGGAAGAEARRAEVRRGAEARDSRSARAQDLRARRDRGAERRGVEDAPWGDYRMDAGRGGRTRGQPRGAADAAGVEGISSGGRHNRDWYDRFGPRDARTGAWGGPAAAREGRHAPAWAWREPVPGPRYEDRSVTGRVLGFERVTARLGEPAAVVMRVATADGQERALRLGEAEYLGEAAPRIRAGDRVKIRGRVRSMNGRRYFDAREIEHPGGRFTLPEYATRQTIRGRLTGVRGMKARGGVVTAVIGEVRTSEGREMDVLLGRPSDLRSRGVVLQPDDPVRLDGYVRRADGRRTFVIQDVRIAERSLRGRGAGDGTSGSGASRAGSDFEAQPGAQRRDAQKYPRPRPWAPSRYYEPRERSAAERREPVRPYR